MIARYLTGTGVAFALSAAPAIAAPAPVAAPTTAASALSVSNSARVATPSSRKSKLAQPGAIIGLVLAAGIVAGGVILIADDDNSDSD